MKTTLVLSTLGFGGTTIIAQVAPEPGMEWYDKFAQFGFGGICLAIISYMIIKTIPDLLKNHQSAVQGIVDAHAKCVDGLSCNLGEKIERQTAKIEEGNRQQLELLRSTLHRRDGGS